MKTDYHIVSFSGGKDSTAMLLRMIEEKMPIDEVIFCDSGMEFPSVYDHIEKIKQVLAANHIIFTVLKPEHSFEWYMLERPVKSEKHGDHNGMGWPTPTLRWCTRFFKTEMTRRYYMTFDKDTRILEYVGIAKDEEFRTQGRTGQLKRKRYPLIDWGMTEADCLQYCYDRGYDWNGHYKIFNRLSCWCCPLAKMGELKKVWQHYPELWKKLEELDEKVQSTDMSFKVYFKYVYTVKDLTKRFENEEKAKHTQCNLTMFGEIE